MMDINSIVYGESIKASEVKFKNGDIFLLSLDGNDPSYFMRFPYKMECFNENESSELSYYYNGLRWDDGHSWNMSNENTYVKMQIQSKQKSIFDGCFCKRCGNYSKYSEPNQEDGTFKCFGCRC